MFCALKEFAENHAYAENTHIMYIQFALVLLLDVISGNAPVKWALTYETRIAGNVLTARQHIVVDGTKLTSISTSPDDDNVAVQTISKPGESITMNVISHRKKSCFLRETSWQEHLDSLHMLDHVPTHDGKIQFVDADHKIKFTAALSDKIPNVYPPLMDYENIQYAPESIEYAFKTVTLVEYTTDAERIAEMLALTEMAGYHVISMDELRTRVSAQMGITMEELMDMIREMAQKKD